MVFLFSICAKLYSQGAKKRNVLYTGASPATESQENNPWAGADKAEHKSPAGPLSPTSAQGNYIYWGKMELTAHGSSQEPEEQIKSPFLYPKKGCSALRGCLQSASSVCFGLLGRGEAWEETKSRQ